MTEKSEQFSIAVLITTFNRPKKLDRCIESVATQNQLPDEIIIVNDGSSITYDSVIEKWSHNLNITWINQANAGVSAARNKGINHSESDYIMLCDDDDFFMPHHVESFKNQIASHHPYLHIYYSTCAEKTGNLITTKTIINKPQDITWQEHFVSNGNMVICCTCMPRRTFIEFPFPLNQRYAEDHEQRLRAMSIYDVIQIQKVTAIVDRTDESTSHTDIDIIAPEYIKRFQTIFSQPIIKKHIRKKYRSQQIFRWRSLQLTAARSLNSFTFYSLVIRSFALARSIQNIKTILFHIRERHKQNKKRITTSLEHNPPTSAEHDNEH